MCGRFSLAPSPKALEEYFQVFGLPIFHARFNIAPSQPVLAIIQSPGNGKPLYEFLTWGLVPGWAKAPDPKLNLINARCETVATKSAFKNPFRYRRCLIPADGFYEWKKNGDSRQPYYFQVKSTSVFALAGLWDHWQSPDGSEIKSCAIITTRANDVVAAVHERMPVILPRDRHSQWLGLANAETDGLSDIMKPFPAGEMISFPVGKAVNRAGYDASDCIAPLKEEHKENRDGVLF